MVVLAYIACIVVAVLMGVAIYYNVLLFRKNKENKAAELAFQEELRSRRNKNINSINIIARAVLDDQVSLTEASIRINALLPTLNLDNKTLNDLSVFRQLSEATAHIPILEKWKALSRKEKLSFDKEREKIESNFRDFVIEAARKIVQEQLIVKS
ncbi:DUF2489 domain-containing protein [Agarilytica rhodophyticola]|uniref:DUF2489 domain-containing protein n=1 Tax=Agarilytica rhodophyticola TaxID=1737490 RepID=UPI000B3449F7|nr:DUF2489 domain-containing protein [Agarilytica rhodophyticola]